MSELATKREAVLAAAKELRNRPGSGFHDDDPGSPQYAPKKGDVPKELPIDEHLVAFKARYETSFAGPCASKAHAAIKEYASENSASLSSPYIDDEERRRIDTAVEYAAAATVGGNLVVRNGQWNDVLAILHAKGLAVTLTA